MTTTIACDAHDYFEIVCMRRSRICVTTHGNQKFQGIAMDIKSVDRQELLCIAQHGQASMLTIALTEIKSLRAYANPHAQDNFFVSW